MSEIAVLSFVCTHIYSYKHMYYRVIMLEAGKIAISDTQIASCMCFP